MKKALITGITGQDGSYLAEFLLSKEYEVHGLIRRASTFNTHRIDHIYIDPHVSGAKFFLHHGDLSDSGQLINLIYNIQPDEVYHLGAQSHVRVSFDTPEYTGDITGVGTTRLLEAIRRSGIQTKFYQASSSEMFGASAPPQNEKTLFYPRSPYAAAKVYAYWMVVNYREGYDLFACNGILFNHECVTADTPIIIKKNGILDILPIEEVVTHREDPEKGKRYSTLGKGLEIWDGNKWSRVITMTATWNKAGSKEDKQINRVICRGGYYEATKDHISFLENEKEIKTGDLRKGDKLELKSLPEINEIIKLTLEEAEFLGIMVADGYINGEEGKGRFINNNRELREHLCGLWKNITGGFVQETTHPSGFGPKRVFSLELRGNGDYLKYIYDDIYTEKKLKRVPKRVLNSSPEIMIAFLRGYNKCDGLKAGHQKTEFKSFTTNSPVLALGLWYLVDKALKLRVTLHPELRNGKIYYHLNINSNLQNNKGKHMARALNEIKKIQAVDYTGWLFDLETESSTFSAGIGLTWIHNSPRRGETFVSRKISRAVANIVAGKQKKLYLGNLKAKRDWGYAPEYVVCQWLMLQQENPGDYVIGTGESHTVEEFVKQAFAYVNLDWKEYVDIDPKYYRPTEVDHLQADISKAKKILKWEPKIKLNELVKIMIDADMELIGLKPVGQGRKILKEKGIRWTKNKLTIG